MPMSQLCCAQRRLVHPDAAGNYPIEKSAAPQAAPFDPKCGGWIYCELLLTCEVWTSTVVMRRELIEQVGGFNAKLRRGQDYDYWLRASQCTRIDRLDAPLARYRMQVAHDRKYPEINWELTVIRSALEKWGATAPDGKALAAARLSKRLWALNYDFAVAQYQAGRHALAREAFAAALKERPLHLKTRMFALANRLKR